MEGLRDFVKYLGDEEESLPERMLIFFMISFIVFLVIIGVVLIVLMTKGIILIPIFIGWALFTAIRRLGNMLNEEDKLFHDEE